MRIDILSLFPAYFKGPFEESIIARAQEAKLLDIHLVDMRAFSKARFRQVDDRPYGGGPGMVLQPDVVADAIDSVKRDDSHVVYLSPQGQPFTNQVAQRLAGKKHLILLCGHYEGVDERILTGPARRVDEEISIGDYVLTNGCLPAIVLVDAMARFVPGVLGDSEAALQDSFQDQIFDHPHYTRPVEFEGARVPAELQSGSHEKIAAWRRQLAVEKTQVVRPDLIQLHLLAKRATLKREGFTEILPVLSLAKSIRFYKKAFEATVEEQTEEAASIRFCGRTVLLLEMRAKICPEVYNASVREIELDKDRLKRLVSRLPECVLLKLPQVVVTDPDSNCYWIRVNQPDINGDCHEL